MVLEFIICQREIYFSGIFIDWLIEGFGFSFLEWSLYFSCPGKIAKLSHCIFFKIDIWGGVQRTAVEDAINLLES